MLRDIVVLEKQNQQNCGEWESWHGETNEFILELPLIYLFCELINASLFMSLSELTIGYLQSKEAKLL